MRDDSRLGLIDVEAERSNPNEASEPTGVAPLSEHRGTSNPLAA
jgi:hypothetical protein